MYEWTGKLAEAKRAWLRRFGREEDGSMVIFALFIILLMLMVGGMAVDLMRFETNRTRLQATLDRAVLAAADLDQPLNPQEVVEDYFLKAGLLDQLTSVTVTQGFNSRTVNATAEFGLNMMFLKLLGIDRLDAPAASTASESISDVEVMLVLDVSGSMAQNNRLVNLRVAARDFVSAVLNPDTEQRISIGIVPFNGQVNLGPVLRARYNVFDLHGVADANCVDLPAAAYTNTDLSTTLPMPQTAHADTFSATSQTNGFVSPTSNNGPNANNRWCPPSTGNVVRLPNRNITQLHNNINALHAVGATSINAGLRWGLELMDPGSRPMFSQLISAGQIPSLFSGRPYDYGQENTLKVIVLMTDGEHFAEERVNAGFRSGLSPIYFSHGDGNYSIFHSSVSGSNRYWVPHRNSGAGEWRSSPWNSGSGVTQLTWPQVWTNVRMTWVAWQLYARAFGTNATTRSQHFANQMNTFRTLTPVTDMDTQLQTLCNMAKANGVVIFGIAFEAPPNGQEQIELCASSPSHYYNAQGLQIQTVFASIAARIHALRLVQ